CTRAYSNYLFAYW
nr:immunoglobulin heavy chain junction region [Mus musculus]